MTVIINQPVMDNEDENSQETFTSEYAENLLWTLLNEHYGKDIRDL